MIATSRPTEPSEAGVARVRLRPAARRTLRCRHGLSVLLAALLLMNVAPAQPVASYSKVATGASHACGLLDNGTVHCWGRNQFGQLGNGSTVDGSFATPVSNFTDVVDISLGATFSCALRGDGTVWCWGRGVSLGRGSTVDSATPVQVSAISSALSIAAGAGHACARVGLIALPRVMCWGENGDGQLGLGDQSDRLVPEQLALTGVASISLGQAHSCARIGADSTLRCWGRNASGQLGNNTLTSSTVPVTVNLISTATSIAAGGSHTCSRLADASLRCWGDNGNGQLGDGTFSNRLQPVAVANVGNATSVATGQFSTCAVRADATVSCWGSNGNAALGLGTLNPLNSNLALPLLHVNSATQVAVGTSFGCVRLAAGSIRCWGSTGFGQTGTGLTGIVVSQRIVSSTCSLDVDGDGTVGATTDALLLARIALGMSADAAFNGINLVGAGRPDWPTLRAFLASLCGMAGLPA